MIGHTSQVNHPTPITFGKAGLHVIVGLFHPETIIELISILDGPVNKTCESVIVVLLPVVGAITFMTSGKAITLISDVFPAVSYKVRYTVCRAPLSQPVLYV